MEKALEFLKDNFKIYDSLTIIVACSGGPDSMTLLNLCIKLRECCNLKIVCAHVNHNVRTESDSEQEYVNSYCLNNNVIFETMKIYSYSDENFENEARTKRYAYFDDLIKKYNAKYLLTAHHGDDLIETILMRITRGSTLKGYSGFSKRVNKGKYTILRPLIYYTKSDLIKYDENNNIAYVVDKTNALDDHTRNRYRKYVLPILKKESPNVHEKFLKFSETLLENNEYINRKINELKSNIYCNEKIDIAKCVDLDKFICYRLISSILEDIYQEYLLLITDRHVELIYELMISDKPNAFVYLPKGFRIIKEYTILRLEKGPWISDDYKYELSDLVLLTNGRKIEVLTTDIDDNSNFICRLNSNEIKLPLIVRNRRDGDKLIIKGLKGSKKVKDILINEKVPFSDRKLWPIVTDSCNTIVWLPGLKKSQFDKKKNEKYDIIIKYN